MQTTSGQRTATVFVPDSKCQIESVKFINCEWRNADGKRVEEVKQRKERKESNAISNSIFKAS